MSQDRPLQTLICPNCDFDLSLLINDDLREMELDGINITLDPLRQTVTARGETVRLASQEFLVFESYILNPGGFATNSFVIERLEHRYHKEYDDPLRYIGVVTHSIRLKIKKLCLTLVVTPLIGRQLTWSEPCHLPAM